MPIRYDIRITDYCFCTTITIKHHKYNILQLIANHALRWNTPCKITSDINDRPYSQLKEVVND